LRTRLPNLAQPGASVIEMVKIAPNKRSSRDALPRLLYGFQELYSDKNLLDQVLELLEAKISLKKPKKTDSSGSNTGRPGMCLWQILVLGAVRVGKRLTYAGLLDLSNNHRALRGILGLEGFDEEFCEQTLLDNIHLLDDELLKSVNTLIVNAGNELLKKTVRQL